MYHAVIVLLVVGSLLHGKAVDASHHEGGGHEKDGTKRCVCEVRDGDEYDEHEQGLVGNVREINQNMNRLIARAEYVAMKLDGSRRYGRDTEQNVKNLMLRIGALRGSGCPDRQFACGGFGSQCVPDLLVCDGNDDCPNGHDEDKNTCNNPLESGYHFKGRVVFDDCTKRRAQYVELYVQEVERDKMFPSEEKVHALFMAQATRRGYDYNGAIDLHGRYFFATHQAVFDAPEDDGLGVKAFFLPGDADLLELAVIRESTGEICAKWDLHRVDN